MLHEQLQQNQRVAIYAIAGMGGIGKTELALQYALKHLNENTYLGGVCWLRAQQDVGTQIVDFAITNLGLKIPEELKLPQQVTWCWQHWREGLVLIVYDDVQKYEDIQPYLPPVDRRFKVLLTTRLDLPSPVQKLTLEVLTEKASLELLRSIVTDGRIDRELKVAKDICEWLGYLPLGLELAGQYLACRKDLSLTKLWERLQAKRLEAQALIKVVSGMTAQLGIAAAFELSWQMLDTRAKQVAGLLGLFASAPIPWNLVQNCLSDWDEEDLENVQYEQLLGLHLLQGVSEGTYQLHSLIREFFRAKLEQSEQPDQFKRVFATTLATISGQLPYKAHRDAIIAFEPNVPHLKEVANNFIGYLSDQHCCKPLTALGRYYRDQGQYDSAVPWLTQRVEICENRLGSEHPSTAAYYSNLGLLFIDRGEYYQAEKLFKKALEIHEHQSNQNVHDFANCLDGLSGVYEKIGNLDEAELYCKKSLDLKFKLVCSNVDNSKLFNGDITILADYASGLAGFAKILNLIGNNEKAIESCLESKRILEMIENITGKIHPYKPDCLEVLGLILYDDDRYEEAESLHREVLKIRTEILVTGHSCIAFSLNNLASALEKQGKDVEAEKLYLESLDIKKISLPEGHPSVATTLRNLARLYAKQQKYDEASSYSIRASIGASRKERLDIATYLFYLARFYWEQQKEYSKAEPLYKQALEIRQQELGDNHDDVAVCLNNLASIYQHLERYEDAQDCYLRSFEILRQLGSSYTSDAAIILNNLAGLYGRGAELYGQVELYAEAENYYSYALQILIDCLGHNDPKTLQVWGNFNAFLRDVIERGQTAHLSNSPATQQLIQNINRASEEYRD
ncbi:tetratricopeptide repeat protein [Coleofasciculus sp. FACHB-SPT9]|uniref:tetratricopeptide repeat protein n=1 Tax=Cyanophyceae TaxID=3028117 RepID=UPI00168A2DF1|nr:tetratricopeptide repeat protein [Coleofasciculus sp. FACHB-SPT9]MBD1889355.1 tetratricopeptide repeat protein [Coleofasciculus sp. FACHB-SPT9]